MSKTTVIEAYDGSQPGSARGYRLRHPEPAYRDHYLQVRASVSGELALRRWLQVERPRRSRRSTTSSESATSRARAHFATGSPVQTRSSPRAALFPN